MFMGHSGYKYLSFHGHRRRFFTECTVWPLHFANVWEAFGKRLAGKQAAIWLPSDSLWSSRRGPSRLPKHFRKWASPHGKLLLLPTRELPQLYRSYKNAIDAGDFAWLDLDRRFGDYSKIDLAEIRYHKDPYRKDKEFILASRTSIIYHNHDDDFCCLYLRDTKSLEHLLQYELINFMKNKYGRGFFEPAASAGLHKLAGKRLPTLPDDILSRLLIVLMNTGFTCYVDDLVVDKNVVTLKLRSGLPQLIWEEGHVRVDRVNQSLSLNYDMKARRWHMSALTRDVFPAKKKNARGGS
jgi:hypothetical protein